MNYLITDHLSSVVAVTDASGLLLEETRYMPFGGVRSDVGIVTTTDKSFTGQKVLPDTGLMDYNARMYSPELGRFTQPDTIIPGAGNPQAWNRYSYVFDNPVMYIDPDGHKACESWDEYGKCIVDKGWQKDKRTESQKEKAIKTIRIREELQQYFDQIGFCVENFNLPLNCHAKFEDIYELAYYEEVINWSNIDYLDLYVNSVGIIGDAVMLASFLLGETAIAPAIGIYVEMLATDAEYIGIAYSVYKLYSTRNPGPITIDFLVYSVKQSKPTRLIPVFGMATSIYGLKETIKEATDLMPVYERKKNETIIGPIKN